jgi:CrcB protein
MKQLLLVGAGGAIGSLARYLAGIAVVSWAGSAFPLNTLLVNVVGSFAMGLLIALLARFDLPPSLATDARLFLAVGVLGGFTTFSSFSADVAALWERDAQLASVVYVFASVGLSIAAIFLGLHVVRRLAV